MGSTHACCWEPTCSERGRWLADVAVSSQCLTNLAFVMLRDGVSTSQEIVRHTLSLSQWFPAGSTEVIFNILKSFPTLIRFASRNPGPVTPPADVIYHATKSVPLTKHLNIAFRDHICKTGSASRSERRHVFRIPLPKTLPYPNTPCVDTFKKPKRCVCLYLTINPLYCNWAEEEFGTSRGQTAERYLLADSTLRCVDGKD